MRFDGDQLRAILAYQSEPVLIRDGFGRPEVEYAHPMAALAILRRGNYHGVGHAKRIRFIQPDSVQDRVIPWGAEADFGAPRGAGFQYIGVRAGAPRRRVNGASSNKIVKPTLLVKPSPTVVDAPPGGPRESLRTFAPYHVRKLSREDLRRKAGLTPEQSAELKPHKS
jgi:hypothetical protein